MPYYCRSLISQALNHKKQKSMSGSQILVLGVAYKPDIGDVRESPALKLIELLRKPARTSPTTTRTCRPCRASGSSRCRSSPRGTTA